MTQNHIYQKVQEAVAAIQKRINFTPEIAVVLGSGLGTIADQVTDRIEIPYSEIPHFHGTSVEGHAGKMVLGSFQGVKCLFLQGRFHLYEGYPMDEVVLPTRCVCALGAHTLVLTNAAGGVNADFTPGDIMIIEDHINLMGDNPLIGPNIAEMGPRFPDLSEAYSKECISIVETIAKDLNIKIQKGVYASMLGPTYETPAEVRMLRTLGVDAVGMSTVPESIAANHFGIRVLGMSGIANLAAGMTNEKLTHKDVVEKSKICVEKIRKILEIAIPRFKR